MRESIIGEKSFRFAVSIINIYKNLITSKNEYILSKQLLKSGTSIGANVREALEGQSKKDFISKISIALKEAVETEYWIELLCETDYIDSNLAESILDELKQIIKILNRIIKTTKKNLAIEN